MNCISSFGFRLVKVPIKTDSQMPLVKRQGLKEERDIIDKGLNFVLIDDVDNVGDILYDNKGKVKYKYYISKFELTNNQYARFLNSVAAKSDPYGLYNENMSNSVLGGIVRTGVIGRYKYTVKPNWENKPVVYIGYYDAVGYVNWLHFGCPNTGDCILGTTEGDETQGAYCTRDFEIVRFGKRVPKTDFGKRNRGTLFWVPNENEWYKAAYYDPTRLGRRKYWDYPNRSSSIPNSNEANYLHASHLTCGSPYYLSDVDNYRNAASYFGTLQQGGNVWEWIEDWQNGKVGVRGLRGGSFGYTEFGLHCLNTDPGGINDESYVFGVRIAKAYETAGYERVNETFLGWAYNSIVKIGYKKAFVAILALSILCILFLFAIFILCRIKKRI